MNRAGRALGYQHTVIANLCAVPTPTVLELADLGFDAWEAAQFELEAALDGASAVLAGWGISGLNGEARQHMQAQVDWLQARAHAAGINAFWMVDGQPRHPSRWHQYVSDKYRRTLGGTFGERIAQVLVEVPIPLPA